MNANEVSLHIMSQSKKLAKVIRKRKKTWQGHTDYQCQTTVVFVFVFFFLKTLDISDKMVRYTIEKKALEASNGKYKRESHSPWNKLSDSQKQKVKKHIESFPVIDSHYQRMWTKRQFLGANLSIQKMYDLYKEKCIEVLPLKHSMYRNIFCNEYNLSFHHPKKDPCETCNKFM